MKKYSIHELQVLFDILNGADVNALLFERDHWIYMVLDASVTGLPCCFDCHMDSQGIERRTLRLNLKAIDKSKLVQSGKAVRLIRAKEYWEKWEEAGKPNRGFFAEMYLAERFHATFTEKGLPFWKGGDLIIGGTQHVQVKWETGTVCMIDNLLRKANKEQKQAARA